MTQEFKDYAKPLIIPRDRMTKECEEALDAHLRAQKAWDEQMIRLLDAARRSREEHAANIFNREDEQK